MTLPYSKRLAARRQAGATTNFSLGTVPTGKVWVINTITSINRVAVASTQQIYIVAPAVYIWAAIVPATQWAEQTWEGRIVLNAGEEIRLAQTGATSDCDVVITGYELVA